MEFGRPRGAAPIAWLVATTLGVGAAWVGLRPVLDVAVPDRAAPLSAAAVRHLAVPSAIVVPTPTPPDVSPSGEVSPTPSRSRSASPRQSATSQDSPTPTLETVDGWTVTTQPNGERTYLRSFQTPGGVTVIKMIPGQVSLVSATPNPSYTVTQSQGEPARLVVQFVATNTYDIVDAMWWNGRPYAQVSHVG